MSGLKCSAVKTEDEKVRTHRRRSDGDDSADARCLPSCLATALDHQRDQEVRALLQSLTRVAVR